MQDLISFKTGPIQICKAERLLGSHEPCYSMCSPWNSPSAFELCVFYMQEDRSLTESTHPSIHQWSVIHVISRIMKWTLLAEWQYTLPLSHFLNPTRTPVPHWDRVMVLVGASLSRWNRNTSETKRRERTNERTDERTWHMRKFSDKRALKIPRQSRAFLLVRKNMMSSTATRSSSSILFLLVVLPSLVLSASLEVCRPAFS